MKTTVRELLDELDKIINLGYDDLVVEGTFSFMFTETVVKSHPDWENDAKKILTIVGPQATYNSLSSLVLENT